MPRAHEYGLELKCAILGVRAGVAVRCRTLERGIAYYLSLYEDEIDQRAEAFWEGCTGNGLDAAAVSSLELSDAVVAMIGNATWIARGGACAFPLYWSKRAERLEIATRLPIASSGVFSRVGLLSIMSAASFSGSYEPNSFTETPLVGWYRVRRSALSAFDGGVLINERAMQAYSEDGDLETVESQVRTAFEAYGRSQRHVHSAILELSGGYDSTLAAALSRPYVQSILGVSVEFPYYEFRFEAETQLAVAKALKVERVVLNGDDLVPYSPSYGNLQFDEPTVFATGIRHAERVASLAAELKAERIYMGHGGDQLFATDLSSAEPFVHDPISSGPFTRTAWRAVSRALNVARTSVWTHRRFGTFVCDGRQDILVKEAFGSTVRTPFSDLKVFRSAMAWSLVCARRGVRPDKTVLARALTDYLPVEVVRRRGKVAYDGVWMRAYARNAATIADLFESSAGALRSLGLSPEWLIRRVHELAKWRQCSDREVLAAYAVAHWLKSWELHSARDVAWD